MADSASKARILNSLTAVRRKARQPSDVLIASFSSHGFDESRDAYIMPADGTYEFIKDTGLKLSVVKEEMSRSKAEHRLLLLDACQQRVSAEEKTKSIELRRGLPPSEAFAAALARPSAQVKLASCSVAEFSYEDRTLDHVGHGVFT